MDTPDALLERVSPPLAVVPGVVAVVLGGSRATGAAHASSDYDIGLYFNEHAGPDVERLRGVVRSLVDEPAAAQVTEVGGWGPWIVGGGWLTIGGQKVDLLYRPIESVETVIRRFQWEILFSIENAHTAVPRGDETYIAGCAFRTLACAAQVLFAVNRRYLVNEKGALAGAARLSPTVDNFAERVKSIWLAIGVRAFDVALIELGSIEHELSGLVEAAR
jgi:Nucleotidyltransferase domain